MDDDLKWTSRFIRYLMVVNAGCAIAHALYRHWAEAGAFAIWVLNLNMWRRTNDHAQHARDSRRLSDAAIARALMERR